MDEQKHESEMSRHEQKALRKEENRRREEAEQKKQQSEEARSAMARNAKYALAGIALLALVFVVGSFFSKPADGSGSTASGNLQQKHDEMVSSFNLKAHTGSLSLHIHPFVEIEINGEPYPLPQNIGITSNGMRVIHTHDDAYTGKLHIESPSPMQFYLQDFFTVWGKTYSEACIFDNCKDESHDLKVFVNGSESSDWNPPFRDGDRVKIVYASK